MQGPGSPLSSASNLRESRGANGNQSLDHWSKNSEWNKYYIIGWWTMIDEVLLALLDIARYSSIGHDWITLDGAVESFGASETWEMRQRFDTHQVQFGVQIPWRACRCNSAGKLAAKRSDYVDPKDPSSQPVSLEIEIPNHTQWSYPVVSPTDRFWVSAAQTYLKFRELHEIWWEILLGETRRDSERLGETRRDGSVCSWFAPGPSWSDLFKTVDFYWFDCWFLYP